jgi:hypothetical protein
MYINHSLNQSLINKIVVIAVNLSFIQIKGIVLKSSVEKLTEMRYDVFTCRGRNKINFLFSIATSPPLSGGDVAIFGLVYYLVCLVWFPGQNKRIVPLSFPHGCRKSRLKD